VLERWEERGRRGLHGSLSLVGEYVCVCVCVCVCLSVCLLESEMEGGGRGGFRWVGDCLVDGGGAEGSRVETR